MELYWKNLITLLFWEWHLIQRCPLRTIFARFPMQLLKELVSWGSPGACSMIDSFSGDAFGVLCCLFWSTVLQCGARLSLHTFKLTDHAVSGARFLTRGVFECYIAQCRSVAVLCMLYKIRFNHMHPLNGALLGPYVPVRITRGRCFGRTSVHLCANSLQNLEARQDFYTPLSVHLERSC